VTAPVFVSARGSYAAVMTRYADLAAKLLQDAATFFRNVGAQNPALADQMNDNAAVYEQVAELVAADPMGRMDVDVAPPERD
jgi:predicted MarR family transcription regulator